MVKWEKLESYQLMNINMLSIYEVSECKHYNKDIVIYDSFENRF